MATKAANRPRLKKSRNMVMDTVKNIHNGVLETTELLIEESVNSGVKYQKMAARAIRKSEPLLDKQVDMAFDTIETLYGQFESGNKRLQKLLGITKTVKTLKSKMNKSIKSGSKMIESNMDTVSKLYQKTADVVEDKYEDLTGKINKSVKEVTPKKVVKSISKKKITKKVRKATKKVSVPTMIQSNLKVIKGIGPKMEKTMKAHGIKSLNDLAKMTSKDLKEIIVSAGPLFKKENATTWIKSAKAAVKK